MSKLVEAVQRGEAEWKWTPLVVTDGETEITISVMVDAMKINGVRVQATAIEAQNIADLIGAVLPTPKIEDMCWAASENPIEPITIIDGDICALSTQQRHSGLVDESVSKHCSTTDKIIRSVGKSWVLTNALVDYSRLKYKERTVANYGWHTSRQPNPKKGGPYGAVTPKVSVWQPLATAHNDEHSDPSQTLCLVSRDATYEGKPADILDILSNSLVSHLVSHEGPLKYLRIPRAATYSGVIVLPPITIEGMYGPGNGSSQL